MAGNGKLKVTAADEGRIDKMVAQYLALREKIRELDARYKAVLEPFELVKNKLGGMMLEFLDQTGQESAKTSEGTVYARVKHTASLADPDVFMEYVIKHGAYDLLDRRANSVACRDHAEEHGELPPGVKLSSIRNAGVRAK